MRNLGLPIIDARVPKYRQLRALASNRTDIPSAKTAPTKAIVIFVFLAGIFTILGAYKIGGFEAFFYLYFVLATASLGLRFIALIPKQIQANLESTAKEVVIAPTYSILIAIYKEDSIVPGLVCNLKNINWPQNKLDIIFLCEADDKATQDAVIENADPLNSRLVIVPSGIPKTKPRALNFGLTLARGRFVTIYDAEDKPHPNQLREAFECFSKSSEKVGMVQAPLVTENEKESLIAALFALDYAIWFRVLLPFFAKVFGFIPLGGTSNHFRTAVLKRAGGWDSYNLTEDADLGIRLARLGYKAKTISLPTYEESPPKINQWVRQRTRWIQGHLQTIAAHLWPQSIRFGNMSAFQYLGALFTIFAGPLFIFLRIPLLAICASDKPLIEMIEFLIVFGLAFEILICSVAIMRDGRKHLWRCIYYLPFYWVLQTIAYLRASIRVFTHPFVWEKTAHGTEARANISKIN